MDSDAKELWHVRAADRRTMGLPRVKRNYTFLRWQQYSNRKLARGLRVNSRSQSTQRQRRDFRKSALTTKMSVLARRADLLVPRARVSLVPIWEVEGKNCGAVAGSAHSGTSAIR